MMADNQTDPKWARNRNGHFHRLLHLNPDEERLSGVSGVYILWHGGLKPAWISVGKSRNLSHDLDSLMDNDDIAYYERRGGIFVSWAQIRDEFQDGVLQYLIQALDLLVIPDRKPAKNTAPIPVLLPGLGGLN